MLPRAEKFARFSLMVERLLDAELLLEEEGAVLLAETEAARQSLDRGEMETARWHVEHVALFTEALVQSALLPVAEGRAVLETARQILADQAD
jgi:hypothetical protein